MLCGKIGAQAEGSLLDLPCNGRWTVSIDGEVGGLQRRERTTPRWRSSLPPPESRQDLDFKTHTDFINSSSPRKNVGSEALGKSRKRETGKSLLKEQAVRSPMLPIQWPLGVESVPHVSYPVSGASRGPNLLLLIPLLAL